MEARNQIVFNLKQFYYYSHDYEWTEMPYYWFCFFKIDGTVCRINQRLETEGKIKIYQPLSGIENLASLEPDNNDTIPIPCAIGQKSVKIESFKVPGLFNQPTLKIPEPEVGCVVVFMNKSCFETDRTNQYPVLIADTIATYFNELIPLLNKKKKSALNSSLTLASILEDRVIKSANQTQSYWKRIFSDFSVDATVWKFSLSELRELKSVLLTKNWVNEGTWELSGEITLIENPVQSQPKNTKTTLQRGMKFKYQP
jgi:hypothetical protein